MFANIGVNMPGGLPYQPWAAELSKKRVANQRYDNPDALCLPQGPLQYHLDPQPRQIRFHLAEPRRRRAFALARVGEARPRRFNGRGNNLIRTNPEQDAPIVLRLGLADDALDAQVFKGQGYQDGLSQIATDGNDGRLKSQSTRIVR